MVGHEPDAATAKALKMDEYTYDVICTTKAVFKLLSEALQARELLPSADEQALITLKKMLTEQDAPKERYYLKFKNIQQLHSSLRLVREKSGDKPMFLHEVMMYCGAEPVLPRPAAIERSPELEARLEKLRLKLAEEEYKKMTKDVASKRSKEEPIGKELRQLDSQLMFMFNFVVTVLAAFAFGYKAVEYSLQTPNTALQLTVGVVLATIVFFADLYFIVKDYDKETSALSMKD